MDLKKEHTRNLKVKVALVLTSPLLMYKTVQTIISIIKVSSALELRQLPFKIGNAAGFKYYEQRYVQF